MVRLYRITEIATPQNLQPRYNIAPTQTVNTVRTTQAGGRALVRVRWGLIPPWAKDESIAAKMINARGETVAEKPSFRNAFRERRCLIPTDGFYEWRTEGGHKQPYRITLKDGGGFAFAGLWERWDRAADGVPVETCTIVTTGANDDLAPIHHRMPVILDPADHEAWLDVGGVTGEDAQRLVRPFPDGALHTVRVSRHVNNARNDDEACILPEPMLL